MSYSVVGLDSFDRTRKHKLLHAQSSCPLEPLLGAADIDLLECRHICRRRLQDMLLHLKVDDRINSGFATLG